MYSNLKLYTKKKSGSIIIYVSVLMYALILCFLYIVSLQCNEYKVLCHDINYSKKQFKLYDFEQILFCDLFQDISKRKREIVSGGGNKDSDILSLLNGYTKRIDIDTYKYIMLTVKNGKIQIEQFKYGKAYIGTLYSIILKENKLLITATEKISYNKHDI